MLDWILNTPLELHEKNKEKEAFLLIHGNIYIYIYINIYIYIHTYIYKLVIIFISQCQVPHTQIKLEKEVN